MGYIAERDMVRGSPLHGWHGRFFHSANMTFAKWTIDADAHDLHEHQHEQEEVWNVVAGEIVLTIGADEWRVPAGDSVVVPPNTPHSARVVGPAVAVVADFPVRESLPGVPAT